MICISVTCQEHSVVAFVGYNDSQSRLEDVSMSTATASPIENPAMPRTPKIDEDTAVTGPYHWTRDEYHKMAEIGLFQDTRVELLGGEIWNMSPQRRPHYRTIRAVAEALEAAFGPAFDIQQQAPLGLGSDGEPEPDVAVVAGSWADYDDHPTITDVKLVVEVSDSTLTKDRTKKAHSYAQAGILDYWIVNLVNRQMEIYRDPSPEGVYQSVLILGPAESIVPLNAPDVAIRVADLLPPTTQSSQL
jgi:Uma2 family endonuclease